MKKLLCVLMFGMVFGQTKLETRVYELNNITVGFYPEFDWSDGYSFSVDDLTGVELEYATLRIVGIRNHSISEQNSDNSCDLALRTAGNWNQVNQYIAFNFFLGSMIGKHSSGLHYHEDSATNLFQVTSSCVGGLSGDILISITAPFPEEDTELQGDMNGDEILDILDVVLMVNIILDGDQSFNLLDTIDSFSRI